MMSPRNAHLPSSYVVIDFETTGFSAQEDEPIQVAALRYEEFVQTEKFVSYIRPSRPIPANIAKFTGITDADVADAPSLTDVFPALIQFLKSDTLVAHHATFDMQFLEVNMRKVGLPYYKYQFIDTVPLARRYIPTQNHKLPTLKAFLNLQHIPSHEAESDCYVTSAVYEYCYQSIQRR